MCSRPCIEHVIRDCEEGGRTWRGCTLYRKRCPLESSECCVVVLWFGGDEYEGMSGDYIIRDGVIRDGNGDQIFSRALQPIIMGNESPRRIERELKATTVWIL